MPLPIPLDQLVRVGSSITIEELDVTFPGGKLRKLVLLGGAMPRKGQAKWAGDSRLVTTWFTGNGLEGSQQVLGPTELPSTWAGMWNRTRMGRAPSIFVDETGSIEKVVDPKRLYDIFEDFRIAAPRLRVTWAIQGTESINSSSRRGASSSSQRRVDFTIVREGRVKQVSIDPELHTDIPWSIEFHWVSRGGRLQRVAHLEGNDDVSKITSSVQDSIEALDTYAQTAALVARNARIPRSASKLTLGKLEAIAAAPQAAVNRTLAKLRYNVSQFRRAGEVAKKIIDAPEALGKSVEDFATNTVAVANSLVDQFGRTPFELLTNKQRVADAARAQRFFGTVLDSSERIARDSSDLALKVRLAVVAGPNRGEISVGQGASARADQVLEIHVCKAGDTPARVSTKYFGNPDQVVPILKTNRLPLHTPTFRPGQILVIPTLASGVAAKVAGR